MNNLEVQVLKFSDLMQPFPYSRGWRKEVDAVVRVSTFAMVLIFILRPFGLENASTSVLLGYWLTSLGIAVANLLLFNFVANRWFNEQLWTVGREALKTLYYLLCLAIGIMLYSHWVGFIQVNLMSGLRFTLYTLLIGAIPATVRALSIYNWLLKQNLKEAERLNAFLQKEESIQNEQLIRIKSNILKEEIETTNQRLVYLESAQNYVELHSMDKDKLHKDVMRISLKNALEQIDDSFIAQCHRSFVVNLRWVEKVRSNSQGIRLCLKDLDVEIPFPAPSKRRLWNS